MSPRPDSAAVLDALRGVRDPDLHKDIVSLGFVKNLAIDGGFLLLASFGTGGLSLDELRGHRLAAA